MVCPHITLMSSVLLLSESNSCLCVCEKRENSVVYVLTLSNVDKVVSTDNQDHSTDTIFHLHDYLLLCSMHSCHHQSKSPVSFRRLLRELYPHWLSCILYGISCHQLDDPKWMKIGKGEPQFTILLRWNDRRLYNFILASLL